MENRPTKSVTKDGLAQTEQRNAKGAAVPPKDWRLRLSCCRDRSAPVGTSAGIVGDARGLVGTEGGPGENYAPVAGRIVVQRLPLKHFHVQRGSSAVDGVELHEVRHAIVQVTQHHGVGEREGG